MSQQGLLKLIVAMMLCLALSHGYLAQARAQESAEKWEELASIQLEVATGYDSEAEARIKEAFQYWSPPDSGVAADLLNRAGDNKFIAFESYQKANTNWENAARAYGTARDDIRAMEARGNAVKSKEAAKRTLREGTEIYKAAANMYESTSNLEKKWEVIGKLARNIERLMGLK